MTIFEPTYYDNVAYNDRCSQTILVQKLILLLVKILNFGVLLTYF